MFELDVDLNDITEEVCSFLSSLTKHVLFILVFVVTKTSVLCEL